MQPATGCEYKITSKIAPQLACCFAAHHTHPAAAQGLPPSQNPVMMQRSSCSVALASARSGQQGARRWSSHAPSDGYPGRPARLPARSPSSAGRRSTVGASTCMARAQQHQGAPAAEACLPPTQQQGMANASLTLVPASAKGKVILGLNKQVGRPPLQMTIRRAEGRASSSRQVRLLRASKTRIHTCRRSQTT